MKARPASPRRTLEACVGLEACSKRLSVPRTLLARADAHRGLLGRPLGRLLSSWKIPAVGKRSLPRFRATPFAFDAPPSGLACGVGRPRASGKQGVGASALQQKGAMRVRSKPSLDVCNADLIACTLRAPEQRLVRPARHRAARNVCHGAQTLRQAIARQRLQVRELDVGTPDQDFW
jgi:hypothetical protein